MTIFPNNVTEQVSAADVRFDGNVLQVMLSDGRMISLPVDKTAWLQWLAQATPEQRENWSLEPGGFAVYWEDLDDGLEVAHLLGVQPLV